MATQFKLRRDTAANWATSNPTLAAGEPGFETDTNKLKLGNGTSPWNSLAYLGGTFDASAITSGTFDIARLPTITVAKGGTGATDATTARTNLGITPANIGAATQADMNTANGNITALQSYTGSTRSIAEGGTGATTAANARSNLGAASQTDMNTANSNISSLQTYAGSVRSIAEGGTGANNAASARSNLGAAASSHTHDGSAIVSGNINVPGSVIGTSVNVNNGVGGYSVQMAQNGNVIVGGTLNVVSVAAIGSSLYNAPAYDTPISTGGWKVLYVRSDGLFGYASSTETAKQDIVPTDLDPDAILDVQVSDFRYIDAVKLEGDNAPVQTGVIAERLIEAGLGRFVMFDDKGKPEGVHYERLVLAVIPQLQAQAKHLSAIEARLEALEK